MWQQLLRTAVVVVTLIFTHSVDAFFVVDVSTAKTSSTAIVRPRSSRELGGDLLSDLGRPSIVFCTSELEHLTTGGAGVVVADSARALAVAGWRVLIIIDIEREEEEEEKTLGGGGKEKPKATGNTQRDVRAWLGHARKEWLTPHQSSAPMTRHISSLDGLAVRTLSELAADWPPAPRKLPLQLLLWRKSQQWARALERIGIHDFDAVEFWDCGGPAYHFLLWRERQRREAGRSMTPPTQIWTRTHGLHQAIQQDSNQSASHSGLAVVYHMETRALQLADAVIANSPGIARAYHHQHNLDPARIVVIPPTLGTLKSVGNQGLHSLRRDDAASFMGEFRPSRNKNVLVYGKLQRVKGPDIAARALVQVMQELAGSWDGAAIFAGDEMPCDLDPTMNMSACILSYEVAPSLRHRFRFVGRLKRGTLGAWAQKEHIRLAILPSRYETFCLAAHEAAYFSIPVVLPRLPAYEGYFVDGRNALMFSGGSARDLARALRLAVTADDAIDRISTNAYHISYPDPAQRYRQLLLE